MRRLRRRVGISVQEDPFSGETHPRLGRIARDLDAVVTDAQSRDWSADRADRLVFARLGQARHHVQAAAVRRPFPIRHPLAFRTRGTIKNPMLLATSETAGAPAAAQPGGTSTDPTTALANGTSGDPATVVTDGTSSDPVAALTSAKGGDLAAVATGGAVGLLATGSILWAAGWTTGPLALAVIAVVGLWAGLIAVAVLRRLRRRWDRLDPGGPAPIDDPYRYAAFRRRIEACAAGARVHHSVRRRATASDLEHALDWLAAAQTELPRR